MELEKEQLTLLLTVEGHKNLLITTREWNQLEELILIMTPFYNATVLAQGEYNATISIAVPLYCH